MRAIAVLVVVLYHARLAHVTGGYVGVDVFFVISGFLITRLLVKSVGTRGVRALPTFYTRRIRRLLPAATTVTIVTVLATRAWAPALQVRDIAVDAIYTTFYGLNYRLASEGTQYLHQDDAASPFQHFWSLGVEEQFYLCWPILIVLVAWIGRRHRNALLFIVLAAVTAISFRYSVTVTKTSQPWAYFSLHTRAWELGAGALVAIACTRLARMPRWLAQLCATCGLAAVIASAFCYTDATAYPGSAAALPVVGAALLIAGGCGPRCQVERLLADPMLQCVGRVSYSLYLWHWPLLIITPMIVGHPLNWFARLALIWLAFLLSILTYFLIEDPGRKLARPNWQWFSNAGLCAGAVVGVGVLVIAHLPSVVGHGHAATVIRAQAATPTVVQEMRQAVAQGLTVTAAPSNLTPRLDKAAHDLPPDDNTSCHASFTTVTQGPCVYGDPAGTHTAVLLGDSHADMWLPAFDAAGRHNHWRVVSWTKSSCPAADITVFNRSLNRTYTECDTWRKDVLSRIASLRPERVFVSDSENVAGADVSPQTWSQDTLRTMNTVRTTTKAQVVLLQDVPVPAYDMPSCVAQHLSSVRSCTFPVDKAYSFPKRHRTLGADAQRNGFPVVEPRSWICTDERCPAVVGNMLVYRDDTHLTATFSNWLTPMVSPLLPAG